MDFEGFGQVLNRDGYIPTPRRSTFAVGLDLGQAADPTAVAIVEKVQEPIPPPEGIGADLIQRLSPPTYLCRHLHAFPLQMAYPEIIIQVGKMMSTPPLKGSARLVLDATGCGRPVADMFKPLDPVCVLITGGLDVERRDWQSGSGYWHVSKTILVSRLQALLHSGTIEIAKRLPAAKLLANELSNFRANISQTGYATFGARVGKHDDLVLALALACLHLAGPRGVGSFKTGPLEL